MMGLNCHEAFIVHLARLVRPKLFVKLGLFQCVLFNQMTPYAEKSIGVDILPEAGNYIRKSQDTRFVMGTTQEFVKELEDNPLQINMLFIDGDHSKVAEQQDFQEFFPFIAPQGLILFQDFHPENAELRKPRLGQATRSYEFIPIPVSSCLTVCRKRPVQLSQH